VSPHLAAEQTGVRVEPAFLVAQARRAAAAADALIVEGVGGLLVPLAPEYLVRDFAVDLGLPVVVVASPGLGTINHSLLTVEAARSVGLDVRAVVLTPWPDEPGAVARSNRDTIAALAEVRVSTLVRIPVSPRVAPTGLPVGDWLPELGEQPAPRIAAGRF
jgi:dethiobiotin synthetase